VAVFDAITGLIGGLLGGEDVVERPYVTHEELAALVEPAEREGVVDDEEETLIRRVLRFSDVTAVAVMVPRADVVAVPAGAAVEAALETCPEARVTQAPVYDGTIDRVLGHVDVRDLAAADPASGLDGLFRPVLHVFEPRPLDDLLGDVQDDRVEFAVVFDGFGATEGVDDREPPRGAGRGDIRRRRAAAGRPRARGIRHRPRDGEYPRRQRRAGDRHRAPGGRGDRRDVAGRPSRPPPDRG
jgi:Mg2+/Co2+ transporter CorB